MKIPFNKPYMSGKELDYLKKAHETAKLSGDGEFTKKCQRWLEKNLTVKKALLTQSCTSALEMAAILINIQPGDEIIMPSYTFVSTANAFVLRGGVPVFIDIRSDTLNIDESKIEAAITPKTKAIVPVHYAGVSCDMDKIMMIAKKHGLYVIEDAAQGLMSTYNGQSLGSFGHLATLSFHETKNIISGEGGALLINDEKFIERAEVIWEKGTNRKKFFRGEVDKYTWVDVGSSYLPSELTAAFLWAQLEEAEIITNKRRNLWEYYHTALADAENKTYLKRPFVPTNIKHNGHIYYILVYDLKIRTKMINKLNNDSVNTVFHYIPLHLSPAGKQFGRAHGTLDFTNLISERIIRLPLYIDLNEEKIDYVINTLNKYLKLIYKNTTEKVI